MFHSCLLCAWLEFGAYTRPVVCVCVCVYVCVCTASGWELLLIKVQAKCLAIRSPANRTANPPHKKADRFSLISFTGGPNLRPKVFRHFAEQYDMNGSGLQVGQSQNGHWLLDYTTADQYGFTGDATASEWHFCLRVTLLPPSGATASEWRYCHRVT